MTAVRLTGANGRLSPSFRLMPEIPGMLIPYSVVIHQYTLGAHNYRLPTGEPGAVVAITKGRLLTLVPSANNQENDVKLLSAADAAKMIDPTRS